jgi:hypothetical protein
MDTKKATDVKDNRLYECFVASGGCSFLETFKLCMYDVLSQNLINEMQKKKDLDLPSKLAHRKHYSIMQIKASGD